MIFAILMIFLQGQGHAASPLTSSEVSSCEQPYIALRGTLRRMRWVLAGTNQIERPELIDKKFNDNVHMVTIGMNDHF